MVEPGEGGGVLRFAKGDAQLFGGSAPVNLQRLARDAAATGQYLAGVWIGGQAPCIDAVAVVLGQ